MRRTPWFHGDVKPVRKGLYERLIKFAHEKVRYSYWDGSQWFGWGHTKEIAHANGVTGAISSVQNAKWRGLRSPSTRSNNGS